MLGHRVHGRALLLCSALLAAPATSQPLTTDAPVGSAALNGNLPVGAELRIAAVPQTGPLPPFQQAPAANIAGPPQRNQRGDDLASERTTAPLPAPDTPASAGTTLGQPATSNAPRVSGPSRPRPIASPLLPARPVSGDSTSTLITAFDLALDHDATYRAAIAERDVNLQTANQTIAAYLPSASYNYQNVPTESGARQVVTVTQPIVSFGALATLRQRKPRRAFAEATLDVREQDLATRTLTAVIDIVRATEASTLNEARIDAFRIQSERANRLYQAGQGTITDARDIQVRYEQALANRILLKSDQIAASARLRSITGAPTNAEDYVLPGQFGTIELAPVDTYLAQQIEDNPQVEAARQTERINKLEADRVLGSLLPIIGASATYSRRGEVSDSFIGFSINAPLNAGSLFQTRAARATARRSADERRAVEERASTELQRLHALVDGGQQALVISARAISAAELSVEANTKSYEGGVRTNVDVVNAIQTVFEVKNAYVQGATTLASNYLNLLLLSGMTAEDAMAQVQSFLYGR